jgi:DNA integrity scanning protein DisA with diadenylate cyclase activity
VIDILIVALLIYEVLRLVRATRAVQMAVGLVVVALLFQLSTVVRNEYRPMAAP